MLIFQYRVSSANRKPNSADYFRIDVTDEPEDNVITWFHSKKYVHTIELKDIERIIKIIKNKPDIFTIPKYLEPNKTKHEREYSFYFSDGERSNSFFGFDILDYGSRPRKNATLALRTSREIKEYVLDLNDIKTMIPRRLQNWPKYRRPSNIIKI